MGTQTVWQQLGSFVLDRGEQLADKYLQDQFGIKQQPAAGATVPSVMDQNQIPVKSSNVAAAMVPAQPAGQTFQAFSAAGGTGTNQNIPMWAWGLLIIAGGAVAYKLAS